MALKKTFENKDGETLNGYYRVREVGTRYEKDKSEPISLEASFVVELYNYDTGERVDNVYSGDRLVEPTTVWSPERIGVYILTIPDLEPVQNLIIRAYNHLKTLPEFDGATDC
tara:strand:+ start:305 stop:643 length:339 start_codon:yes stop_codon:yes gene_type:complete